MYYTCSRTQQAKKGPPPHCRLLREDGSPGVRLPDRNIVINGSAKHLARNRNLTKKGTGSPRCWRAWFFGQYWERRRGHRGETFRSIWS